MGVARRWKRLLVRRRGEKAAREEGVSGMDWGGEVAGGGLRSTTSSCRRPKICSRISSGSCGSSSGDAESGSHPVQSLKTGTHSAW